MIMFKIYNSIRKAETILRDDQASIRQRVNETKLKYEVEDQSGGFLYQPRRGTTKMEVSVISPHTYLPQRHRCVVHYREADDSSAGVNEMSFTLFTNQMAYA